MRAARTAYDGAMTRQKGRPEPFEWISVVERPVESTVVDAAIATFVSHFVVAARRERARLKLGAAGHRAEALHALESWLDPKRTTALEGNTGFPQRLRARFGELQGVLVRGHDAVWLTVAEAACAAGDTAFFLSDDGRIGLVFAEVGPPHLCTR